MSKTEAPLVISAVDDLFFLSKIESVAKALGISVARASNENQLEKLLVGELPKMIILDLNGRGLAPLGAIRRIKADTRLSNIRLIGFLSHVHHELAQEAREAGCDQVMPRSAFSAHLPKILGSVA